MKGWLLYDRAGMERNRAFIQFWFKAAQSKGVELELHITDNPLPVSNPDFAVVRVMDPFINSSLEARGISVYNSALVSTICNDKWKTYCHAKTLGIPFPATEYYIDPHKINNRPYPFVIKACNGHGGTQVYMVSNDEEFHTALVSLNGTPSVVQEVVSDLGKDLRIYVLGNKVIAAMLRSSNKDFRSNFCLGGKAQPYPLGKDELEIVDAFCNSLPFGLVGIDLMFHNGKPVFNEIEDVVGCRMLYSQTNLNPVEMYLDFIMQNLSKT